MLAVLLLLGAQIAAVSPDRPNQQPQLAALGTNAAVVYGAGNTIFFASSTDPGRTFGEPVVVSSSGELSLVTHRGPRAAYTSSAIAVSAVVGDDGHGKDGDLLAWRS